MSSDSRPSTADEKATVVEKRGRFGFFSRDKRDKLKDSEKNEVPTEDKVEQVVPVGFFQLFRYAVVFSPNSRIQIKRTLSSFATKFELTVNFLSLIAAAATGAAQVCIITLIAILHH
jgi:ATP-binding cassette subfamily B (MDR/TAP) protein 1